MLSSQVLCLAVALSSWPSSECAHHRCNEELEFPKSAIKVLSHALILKSGNLFSSWTISKQGLGYVIKKKHLRVFSWISLAISPPLSAVTLTAIPYGLQCSHIRASHQLPWLVFLVFTLYQPAVLLCGVQDSQQQLCPTESTCHLQPQLHNLAK